MRAIIVVFALFLPGLADAQSIDGSIIGVHWPSGEVSGDGYSGYPAIEIENSGSEPHEFWIQVSVQDPNGRWHINGFSHTETIASGKRDDFRRINVRISPHNEKMPVGYYNGKVELYADFYKHDKLDSQTQRKAFEVNT